MKNRIIRFSTILVAIGIIVTAIFTSALARYFYKYEAQSNIRNIASLLVYQLENDYNNNRFIDYDILCKTYAKTINERNDGINKYNLSSVRITIIDYDGAVLGESDTNVKDMANHLDRKEVQEALSGNEGTAQRTSNTLGYTYIYVTIPVKDMGIIVRVSIPLNKLNSINIAFLCYTIIGLLVGLLFTMLLAVKLSHIITDPIYKLISISKEISRGNYKKRVDINSNDEIGQLAATFNEMAEKLDSTLSDVMNKNIRVDTVINSMSSGIIAVDNKGKIILINTIACNIFGVHHGPGIIGKNIGDITRNIKINSYMNETISNNVQLIEELSLSTSLNSEKIYRIYTSPIKSVEPGNLNAGGIIALNDITALKKLEQMRTEFVSNVSHELKTPLTSIRGFVETLKSGAIEDTEIAAHFLDIIDIEAERLYILINDILQLSEIEAMRKDENVSQHYLMDIVSEVMLILENAANKKNIKLEVNCNPNIEILANKDRIKQMLINLIDNAIKYNFENGTVYINAEKISGKLVISIKDTGIGIPEAHQSRIFERFHRVDKGRSRNMGGTGLGLSIVKHIVNLYSGDIRVISEPGKGSEFIIQLPL